MAIGEISPIDERLRKVAAQMRKHPDAVNGRIAADLIERELNNADVIDIGGYSHEDLSKLITLHEGNWSISFEKEVPANVTEIKRAATTEGISKLSELAKPLIDYLHKNYHPHVSIVVTDTGVEVSEIILSIPECTMD